MSFKLGTCIHSIWVTRLKDVPQQLRRGGAERDVEAEKALAGGEGGRCGKGGQESGFTFREAIITSPGAERDVEAEKALAGGGEGQEWEGRARIRQICLKGTDQVQSAT